MTHRLATNYAKNYCNRTLIVKVIVENVVTCFFWDTVYVILFLHCSIPILVPPIVIPINVAFRLLFPRNSGLFRRPLVEIKPT